MIEKTCKAYDDFARYIFKQLLTHSYLPIEHIGVLSVVTDIQGGIFKPLESSLLILKLDINRPNLCANLKVYPKETKALMRECPQFQSLFFDIKNTRSKSKVIRDKYNLFYERVKTAAVILPDGKKSKSILHNVSIKVENKLTVSKLLEFVNEKELKA